MPKHFLKKMCSNKCKYEMGVENDGIMLFHKIAAGTNIRTKNYG